MVVLEGLRAPVGGPGAGLDDQALLAPEEIDREPTDLLIDLGPRDPVAAAKPEERGLDVAAGAVGGEAGWEIEKLRRPAASRRVTPALVSSHANNWAKVTMPCWRAAIAAARASLAGSDRIPVQSRQARGMPL